MSRVYASPKDRQPEVRTKVPEELYDALEEYAALHGATIYEAARALLRLALYHLEKSGVASPGGRGHD